MSRLVQILLITLWSPVAVASHHIDVQFFGDVYLPARVLQATGTTAEQPNVYAKVQALLDGATHNVVNLEGAATTAFVPHEPKRFLLRMPLHVGKILRAAGIGVATLANNHVMDFGYQGVFDTLVSLKDAGIQYTGAGRDLNEARRPVLVQAGNHTYCILAFSKTYPESFWATAKRPGTATTGLSDLTESVANCAARGFLPVVSFHWSREGLTHALSYQRALARGAIEAGAWLVVGHHPHVLQEIEVYRGRLIVYSLGNFTFGSLPFGGSAEGLAAGLSVAPDRRSHSVILTPLKVDNHQVRFQPRLLDDQDEDPLTSRVIPDQHPCRYIKQKRHWACLFRSSDS